MFPVSVCSEGSHCTTEGGMDSHRGRYLHSDQRLRGEGFWKEDEGSELLNFQLRLYWLGRADHSGSPATNPRSQRTVIWMWLCELGFHDT